MNSHSIRDARTLVRVLLGTLVACVTVGAQAFPNSGLFLNLADQPDFRTLGATLNLNDGVSGPNRLLSTGFTTNLRLNNADNLVTGPASGFGAFTLDAALNGAGEAIGGTLTIDGAVATVPGLSASGNLLTGDLIAFGTDAAADTMHFLFNNLTGDAAALFGDEAGVILSGSGFPGGPLSVTHTNLGTARTNTRGVASAPAPGTLALFLVGATLMWQQRRRDA